jgi:hypothetical protein
MFRNRALCLVIVVAALAASISTAEATVVHSDALLARGEFPSSTEMNFVGPRTYRITAADLHWLNSPLSALRFGAFTPGPPPKQMFGAGTLEFFYAGRSRVLFFRFYGRHGWGWFVLPHGGHVTSAAPVPLPASLWLLSSALALAGIASWIRRRARSFVARAAAVLRPPRFAEAT